LHAVALEFGKMGAVIEEKTDGLVIEGGHSLHEATCFAHHDHRIAMSLAIAGSAARGVTIEGADCVEISYPDFYEVLARFVQ
jgi:3-phosphoshikimate 1-carboxyvinyltransferase